MSARWTSYNSYTNRVIPLNHYRQRQAMINLAETLQTPPERRLLLYLRNSGCPVSLWDICHACRFTEQDARSFLAILVNKGLVRREGTYFVSP
jgi:hypothetical protein